MRKLSVCVFALTTSLSFGVTSVGAKDTDLVGGGGGGGEKMHHDGGGSGGGEKMRHDGGGERMRHRDEDGDMEHHHRGHWRGGVWIYDYDGRYGGGGCYRWRHICADRWGWGGPGFRRCLWRHGC